VQAAPGDSSGGTALDDLRAWEEHFRLAQEAGGIGSWEWDLTTGRMRWSAQMFRNLGLAPEYAEASYETLLAAAEIEDRQPLERTLADLRRRTGPMRVEIRVAWPGGDRHWIVFLGRAVGNATGRPVRALGITIDGTDRRRREEAAAAALLETERRLRELNEQLEELAQERARQLDASRAQIQAICDNSPDWLTLFRATADGRFVYADLNPATERAYGIPRHRVIGRTVEEILGLEPAQLPLRLMRACIATGENQRYTARRTMAGVTRAIDVMFVRVPEKYDGDWFIMATARDITEREQIEQQLRQAQKMEALGQLTGGIAHDFNNLLTAIIGNLELLAPRLARDKRGVRLLEAAERSAHNGAKLTEQLLAFSRRQHLQPRAVDLNEVVGNMHEMLVRTIGTGTEMLTDLTPELWPALVDPTQIEIAILNLAINSRDAMPLGGRLTIGTRNLPAGSEAAPSEIRDRDCVCLSVRDTGVGMAEEVLHLAVEPFFTTKPVGKGSGLGLSQVYGMLRQSNGAFRIDSEVGRGTSVYLYLPKAAGDVESEAQRRKDFAPQQRGGRILVVDDDPAVREITVQMLRESGYGVAEAESGQAALDALSRGESYDLVVIDIAMAAASGIETVRRARAKWPGLRALYITGYADAAGAMPDTGDDPMLKKPFRLGDLNTAVHQAMHREVSRPGAPVLQLRGRRS
jgi:PAS domain S-box-containing protein